MLKFISSLFAISIAIAAPANAIEIDITNHKDRSFFEGFEEELFYGCSGKWVRKDSGKEYIIYDEENCSDLKTDERLKYIESDIDYIKKNYKQYSNFKEYFAERKNKDDTFNRLPDQYWDFMPGYKYEYSKHCSIAWHERTSSFLMPYDCYIGNEKLKDDAIKSIEYVKANSNAKNFDEYYRQVEKKQKTQNQGYTIEDSRVDAVRLWGSVCQNRKDYRTAPRVENPMTLEWVIHEFYRIDKKHVATLYHHAVDVVEQYRGRLDCLNGALQSLQYLFPSTDIRAKAYK